MIKVRRGAKLSSGTGGLFAPAANNRLRSRPPDRPSAEPSSGGLRELPSDNFAPRLHLILDSAHSGPFNMQMDEALFRRAIRDQSVDALLRFYRFSELCWTAGYGVWEPDMPAIRRLTGGGIVKHGEDLTYALVTPYGSSEPLGRVRKSYFFIHEALCHALRKWGIRAERHSSCSKAGKFCFDSPVADDVMLGARKVAGGAQKRSQGYLLHQGTVAWPVLLESYPDLSETVFARTFAGEMADVLGLSVKESSPNTDIEHTEFMAWNQRS